MENDREEHPAKASGEADAAAPEGVEEPVRKQIYLRTVYPLNPGIPHYVDVPGGW